VSVTGAQFQWAKGGTGSKRPDFDINYPTAPLVLAAVICWPSQFESHPIECLTPGWSLVGGRSHMSVWSIRPTAFGDVSFAQPEGGEPNETWTVLLGGYRARSVVASGFAKSCQRAGDRECVEGDFCPSTGVVAPSVTVPDNGLAVYVGSCHDEGIDLDEPEDWTFRWTEGIAGDPGGNIALLADRKPVMGEPIPDAVATPAGPGWLRGVAGMVALR
jgi:hypothetical protein